MANILKMLQDSDQALLTQFAVVWGIKIDPRDRDAAVRLLAEAMLDPARAEAVWDKLDDPQRSALQVLVSSKGAMPEKMLSRLFGEIRRMGQGQIERERPLENPAGPAEALFYRGLIGIRYESTPSGPNNIAYIPPDLLKTLPLHKTSYDNLDDVEDDFADDDEGEEANDLVPLEKPAHIQAADTSIVDDMTTLLAFIQLYAPTIEGDSIVESDSLAPFLLNHAGDRLLFLFGVAASADFLDAQAGRLYIKRPEVRRWLEMTRPQQVRALANAWRGSAFYRDLWHVPGLLVEREAGTMPQYDAAAAREAITDLMMNAAPLDGWWSQAAFANAMRLHDRDFQRPNGDYQSWYIRDASGAYLSGEESWNAVEGALINYILNGPLHWLGLLDIGEGGAHLTAYGKAFITNKNWPTPPDPADKIAIKDDGTVLISRKAARIDRFQIARFAAWVSGGDPYVYKLTGESIQAAAEQGITVSHIASFLQKAHGDAPLPQPITRLLESWRGGAAASVTFERLLVLRTTSVETLDAIFDNPALRRYLGARLGPMAVVIRQDQIESLQVALGEQGISIERIG
jgi:hypothetical protein